ncbi:MAG: Methanogen homoaconitase large subunit [Candidatus Methanogaster sp.]|nr:MAG: Methanogen homoaconitase large subunit [ANME-2 cluster archaeon]
MRACGQEGGCGDAARGCIMQAGAAVCAPGCGFCIGRTVALGDGEAVLSTQNRNFRGRGGAIARRSTCRRSRQLR